MKGFIVWLSLMVLSVKAFQNCPRVKGLSYATNILNIQIDDIVSIFDTNKSDIDYEFLGILVNKEARKYKFVIEVVEGGYERKYIGVESHSSGNQYDTKHRIKKFVQSEDKMDVIRFLEINSVNNLVYSCSDPRDSFIDYYTNNSDYLLNWLNQYFNIGQSEIPDCPTPVTTVYHKERHNNDVSCNLDLNLKLVNLIEEFKVENNNLHKMVEEERLINKKLKLKERENRLRSKEDCVDLKNNFDDLLTRYIELSINKKEEKEKQVYEHNHEHRYEHTHKTYQKPFVSIPIEETQINQINDPFKPNTHHISHSGSENNNSRLIRQFIDNLPLEQKKLLKDYLYVYSERLKTRTTDIYSLSYDDLMNLLQIIKAEQQNKQQDNSYQSQTDVYLSSHISNNSLPNNNNTHLDWRIVKHN